MDRTLPYGDRRLPIPDEPFRLEEVVSTGGPRAAAPAPWQAGFERPLGLRGLEETFRGARRVLICVSDATRRTGAERFLPLLVDRIVSSCSAEISWIIGSGIHRAPREDEVQRILGEELARRFPVLLHDPDDDRRLVRLEGTTAAGTPVIVNRAVQEHDRVVLTGAVNFHYYAGFTGGRKAVVPGIAGRETVVRNHLRSLRRDGSRHPAARAGRLAGNPVHRDMAQAAGMVGPDLLVNSVLAEDGQIERLFVGHWRRAHEAACRYVRSTRSVRLEPRDLVLVSPGGSPHDVDLIQAHKGFEAAYGALRPGGVLILAAECPRGAGHDDFLSGLEPGDEKRIVDGLRSRFTVYGQTALSWLRKARRCRLIMVSGLAPALVRRLGAEPARDLEEAFRIASRYHRAGDRGWIVRCGARQLIVPGGDGRGGGA